jgi:glycosyltransferase involved in cell wall biosynthesis
MAKISIGLATYNGEKFIREQLDSLLNQTYTDFEIVISDDRSSDKTLEILRSYTKTIPNIKIFENKENLGFKKNFEKVIKYCESDYIALCDQDDIWDKNHLYDLITNIKDNSLICSNSILVDDNGKSLNITMKEILNINLDGKDKISFIKALFHQNFVQGSTVLFKRNILQYVLPIPDQVLFHDHWIALVAGMCDGVIYLDRPLIKYRQHNKTVTNNKPWNFFGALRRGLPNNFEICKELKRRLSLNFISHEASFFLEQSIDYHRSIFNKENKLRRLKFLLKYHNEMYLNNKKLLFRILKTLLIG